MLTRSARGQRNTSTLEAAWQAALQVIEAALRARGRQPLTIRGYRQDLARAFRRFAALGCEGPAGLTPELLVEDRRRLQARLQPASVNRQLAALKTGLRILAEHRLGPEALEACLGVLRLLPLPPPPAPTVPPRRAVDRLLRVPFPTTWLGYRDRALIQLLLQTGLRVREVARLELRDLALTAREGTLLVRWGKEGFPRTVLLNAAARQALADWLAVRPPSASPALFLGRTKRALSPLAVYRIVKAILTRAGLAQATPHTLRHLFATLLYQQHKDLLLVKEALGHRSVETTTRYARRTVREVARALEGLPQNRPQIRPVRLRTGRT